MGTGTKIAAAAVLLLLFAALSSSGQPSTPTTLQPSAPTPSTGSGAAGVSCPW